MSKQYDPTQVGQQAVILGGVHTLAGLNKLYTNIPAGSTAFTSDGGAQIFTGTAWIPVGLVPGALVGQTIDGNLNTLLNLPASQLTGSLNVASISGQWSVANGGTGAATLTGVVKGNGTSAMTAAVGTDLVAAFTGGFTDSSHYLATDGTQQLVTSGGGTDIQIFTASGTWTKPSGTPKSVRVILIGAGGGGGGGNHVASGTAAAGGGGGGSGGYGEAIFRAVDIGATETVTIGAGGAGAAASGGAGGNNGVAGGTTSFGSWFNAFGGGRGAGTAGGNAGQGGSGSCAQAGGDASGSTSGTNAPQSAGGNGAGIFGAAGNAGTTANWSTGGAGGGGVSTTPTAFAGGNSGRNPYALGATGGAATGANGGAGINPTSWGPGTGGGGGGASNGTNGGTGGAGGLGAGGGGGGSNVVTGSGGAGGAGGAGWAVIITTY